MYFKNIKAIHKNKTEQVLKGHIGVHFYDLGGGEGLPMNYTNNIKS